MWCGRADIPGMPSSSAQDDWGAVTSLPDSTSRNSPQCDLRQNNPAVRSEHPDDVGAPCQWHSAGAGHKGAASLTKAHGTFRKIGEAVNRQGTLTITGSNVRLGTEMPVALSYF